jgi:type I restriction enzyme S subunit
LSEWKETEYGKVPANWNFISASEYCEKVTDGTHDSPKRQEEGNFLITSKHIKGRNIDFENAYLISKADFCKINGRSKVDQWDVIISMIGEYCGFAYLERNSNIAYAIKNVGLFKTGDKNNAIWLYFYIQSKIGNYYLQTNKSGTSQPYITLGTLRKFPILVPSNIEEQKAIVSVLSSLDNKIDLLHRQNKTLEAMAETLFRQWFVEEADEGWEIVKLDSLINISSGKGLNKDNLVEKGIYPVLGANGEIGRTNDFLFDERLLFTGRVGTLGNIFRVENEKVWLSDNTLVIKPKNYFNFIYFVLKAAKLEEYNVGSTQPLIRQSDIKKIEISLPPKSKMNEFEKESELMLEKLWKNKVHIHTIEKMWDTLLPKLMSGEVRVECD